MKITDFNRLKKLMNMTQSGADQEILTAIRSANEILTKSNTTWDRVLDRVIKVEVEIESADQARGRSSDPVAVAARREAFSKKVEDAFATIEASDPRGEAADFIASLKDQWEKNGRLSDRQFEALWTFERNAKTKLEKR